MKVILTFAIALLGYLPGASANFHFVRLLNNVISGISEHYQWNTGVACSSGDIGNCGCVTNWGTDVAQGLPGDDWFQVAQGLCWHDKRLNFYKVNGYNGDANVRYIYYDDNGDGKVKGQCYGGGANTVCGILQWFITEPQHS